MAYEFKLRQNIPFVDTDMAGIVHFSNYFRYMESTEHAFYRSLGFEMHSSSSAKTVGFPRIHVSCRFRRPLYFEDEIETHLLVQELTKRTISYVFYLRRCLADDSPVVARGEVTIACVAVQDGQVKMKGVPIPDNLTAMLEVAPEALLSN